VYKYLLLLLGFVSSLAAQTTPNIGLNIPSYGAANWNVQLNANFNLLDLLLSGNADLPNLIVTGNIDTSTLTITGGIVSSGNNNFSGTNTFTNSDFVLSYITGSTDCLQANTGGAVEGAGFPCNTGTVSGATTAGGLTLGGGGATLGLSTACTANQVLISTGSGTWGCGNAVITSSFITTSAASDNVSIAGVTSSSHCTLTPTDSTAGGMVVGTFVSAKTTNQITVVHPTTSGGSFDILCTPY
jgi:hypothetical protein